MKKAFSSYREYLQSAEWLVLRRIALETAANRCQVCGSGKELHVHHREYPKKYGTEPMSSLAALCSNCHKLFHDSKRREYRNEKLDLSKASVNCCDCDVEVNQWVNALGKDDLCLKCLWSVSTRLTNPGRLNGTPWLSDAA